MAFNYDTQKDQIDRQRALSQKFMSTPLPQGQMVPGGPNGFYAAPSKFAGLAGLLSQLAGMYGMSKADDAQKGLDQQAAEEIAATPWKARAVATEQVSQDQTQNDAETQRMLRQAAGSGGEVGMMDGQATSDAFDQQRNAPPPVAPPPVAPPLQQPAPPPPVAPSQPLVGLAEKLFNPAARVGTEVGRGSNLGSNTPSSLALAKASMTDMPPLTGLPPQPPSMQQLMAKKLLGSMNTSALTNPVPGAPATPQIAPTAALSLGQRLETPEPVQSVASGPAAVPEPVQNVQAPIDPTVARSNAMLAAIDPTRSAPPGQAWGKDGQLHQVSDPRMATQVAADAAQPTQADQIAQIQRLANSGPLGKILASKHIDAMFNPKDSEWVPMGDSHILNKKTSEVKPVSAGGGGKYDLVPDKFGNNIKVFRDGSPSQYVQGPGGGMVQDPKIAEKIAGEDRADKASIQIGEDLKKSINILTKIDPRTGKPTIDAAAGLGGRLSLLYNWGLSDPTKASEAQAEVDGLKSKIFAYGMAKYRAANGGNGVASAANSDAEGKRLELALGNLNISKIGTDRFIQKANEIISEIDTNNEKTSSQIANRDGSNPNQSTITRRPGQKSSQIGLGDFN